MKPTKIMIIEQQQQLQFNCSSRHLSSKAESCQSIKKKEDIKTVVISHLGKAIMVLIQGHNQLSIQARYSVIESQLTILNQGECQHHFSRNKTLITRQ